MKVNIYENVELIREKLINWEISKAKIKCICYIYGVMRKQNNSYEFHNEQRGKHRKILRKRELPHICMCTCHTPPHQLLKFSDLKQLDN